MEFGNPSGDPAPDDPGSYEIDDDPNNPDNPDNPEYSDDPASSDKNVETFIVPADGYYYLETWGASGGDLLEGADYANRQLDKHAGHGGYSYSVAYLTKDTKLYIHLGGKGMNYSESKAKLPDNESQFGGAAVGRMGAAGGSGYVNTGRLSDGQNITGNTANFTTKGGNLVTPTPIPAFEGAVGIEKGAKTMIGNRGNGHARITFIGKNN